ncbi:MAG: translocation/assembly module TamB domain-containing protein [Rhodospirillaceae bacterium]|nr:translocation/assembly module TamB domain-containing protein [Rhodospirillaceae bacterium]
MSDSPAPRTRSFRLAAMVIAATVALIAVFAAAAVSVPALREAVLVRVLQARLQGADVRIEGLANPDLSTVNVARVSFGPVARPEVVVERLRATFNPITLLRGRLAFVELSAEAVTVDATPPESAAPRRRPPYQTLGFVLRDMRVERLAIGRLEIREAGDVARVLAVAGALTEAEGRPVLNLSVRGDGADRADVRTTVSDGVFRVDAEAAIAGIGLDGDLSIRSDNDQINGSISATLPPGLLDNDDVQLGRIDFASAVSGTLAVPLIAGDVRLDNATLGGRSLAALTGTVDLRAAGLDIEGLAFEGRGTFDGLAAAVPELGALVRDRADWSIRGQLTDSTSLSIDLLSLASGEVRIETNARIGLDGGGFAGAGTLAATGVGRLAGADDPASTLRAAFSTSDSGVTFALDSINFDGFGVGFAGRGEMRLSDDRGDVSAARLTGDATVDGVALGLAAELAGPWATAQITARVDAAKLMTGAVAVTQGSVDIIARRSARSLTGEWRARATLDDAPMTASGALNLNQDGRLDMGIASIEGRTLAGRGTIAVSPAPRRLAGRIEARIADLGQWTALAGVAGEGTATLTVDLTGTAQRQEFVAALAAATFAAGPVSAQSATVAATFRRGEGDPALSAEAVLARGDVAAQPFERLTLSANGPLSDLDVSLAADGGADASAEGRGTLGFLAAETRLVLASFAARTPALSLRLTSPMLLTVAADGITLPAASFELNGGNVDIGFTRSAAQVAATVRARNVGARMFTDLTDAPADARIDAAVTLAGPAAAAEGELTASVTGLSDASPKLELSAGAGQGQLRLTADLQDGEAGAARLEATLPGRLDVQDFTLAVSEDSAVSAALTGRGDLARLARWLPLGDLDVSGTVAGEASVSGTLAAPIFAGLLKLTDGAFDNAGLGLALRQIEATATAREAGDVELAVSGADAGRGTFTGTGRIDWSDGFDAARATLRTTLSDLRVLDRDTISARVSGQLDYEGGLRAGRITGELSTSDTEVFLAGAADPDIPLLRADLGPSAQPAAADLFMGGTTLDIAIAARRPVQVSGQGIDSSWQGSVTVGGSMAAPQVNGTLTLQAGNAAFLGQSFDLTAGTISLFGAGAIDPALDITAQRTREEITAIVRVTGRASAPKVDISSSPVYPRDEILSRILFGKDMRRLGPLEAAQIAAASTNVMGEGPGLTRVLRRGLAVDYFGLGGRSGEAIEVRKNFGQRLSIGVEQEVSGQERLFTVEWRLTPRISVRSTSDGQAGGDIGVTWSRDY